MLSEGLSNIENLVFWVWDFSVYVCKRKWKETTKNVKQSYK